MPYDATLDKKLFAKTWENELDRITVSVFSYNNGEKKLQITRENKDADGNARFTKLGRMTKHEVVAVLPFIQEAVNHMD